MTNELKTVVGLGKTTRTLLAACLAFGVGAARADVQPTGATDGVSFVSPAAGVTNITAPNNAIIDYASFNVGAGQTVNFIQPSASSRVLNRINSSMPSRIDGTITANGIVYLINPSGVQFGPNAVVDVAGIYAAAGSLSNDDFVRGIDRFDNLAGAVSHEGLITAESVAALLGREVVNTGTIRVPNGAVIMASGSEVLIGNPLGGVLVQLDVTERDGDGGVLQEGEVQGKQVSLVAGDVFALAATSAPLTSFSIAQADTDGDGDIDQADLETAYANYTGPVGASGGKTQMTGDAEGDGDVDDADLGILFSLYTGPIVIPPPPTPTPVAGDFNLDQITELAPVTTSVNLTEADLGVLSGQLGITPRPLSADERIARAQGRELVNDLNSTGDNAANPDGSYTVAITRLDADVVRAALELYQERLAAPGVDPAERAAQVRASVEGALKNYRSQAPANATFDAEQFVAFLREANPALLSELGALEQLRQMTMRMGLSELEKQNSDRVIINRSRPESLSFEQMKATLASASSLSAAIEREADAG